ncbi:cancer/testis antigen family 45 member A8-like isoform X1 [Canis lupus baileyi]|nr:cancer/testis antigen family 45 member A8-like isoform X1 [Canis lupus dingo]XP_035567486.1 cancer/testis antigen family 45 member A8-like isoform X1 [Canis lupus dingo]XP_038444326.1 cancer/testis antigen family 45 member A8-like isoform X3 [Canis lupus familiaris]XP_038445550.1 cancer/testis antigen family 45 member A8-like isoform X1 [Canis lupus familiaris]XP_038445566.1 cancer/testis antigen family 45 member A8-like isoform X4 [Canis lupus familiaris]|eukprot:XP_005641918.3 cancer/testis antigen family 45 member A2-like [Canis lupus familiaris]
MLERRLFLGFVSEFCEGLSLWNSLRTRVGTRLWEMMTDKAEESAVVPQSQKKHPGKPITPPPSKKMQRMALLSVKEEGEGTSHPGGSAMTLEDVDPKVTAMSVSGDVPDKLPIPIVINMEVKEQLKKEIREFGGQYEKILKLLEGVQGPPELQRKFVIYAMKQAAKVQRQDLIGHLQEVLDKLELDHFLKKDTHTHNL